MPSMALTTGSPGCLLQPCAKSRQFHAFQSNCCMSAPVCTCKSAGQSFGQPSAQSDFEPQFAHLSRRQLLQIAGATALVLQGTPEAKASLFPEAVDNAWSSIGGGPSDLTFPELFLGTWKVQTTLVKVDTPLGPDFVPDLKVVERAQKEDLQHPQKYLVSFMHNNRGQVITDRRFNTSQLVSLYLDKPVPEDVITWNPDNPNQLRMALPGSMTINTRVTRRSQETPTLDKINTSEYFQQIFETPGRPQAKVKASQCYTKYKFRSQEAADRQAGPAIVATQVISDYLTAYDGELRLIKAQNRPVVVYTYSMVFIKQRGMPV
ncbi:MAG: hypothetical protein FRX49_04245 [Trebouxia sp. A1-2]|nr:MAG: hypothetical protein FRX49_04245 [Trebouxia sp. A1-2]